MAERLSTLVIINSDQDVPSPSGGDRKTPKTSARERFANEPTLFSRRFSAKYMTVEIVNNSAEIL